MSPSVINIRSDTTIQEIGQFMNEKNIGSVLNIIKKKNDAVYWYRYGNGFIAKDPEGEGFRH